MNKYEINMELLKGLKAGERIVVRNTDCVPTYLVGKIATVKEAVDYSIVYVDIDGEQFKLCIEDFEQAFGELVKLVDKGTKVKSSIEFNKEVYGDEDDQERILAVYPALEVDEEVEATKLENTYRYLANLIEEDLSLDFARCPSEDLFRGVRSYGDSFYVDYAHGEMTSLRKEIMQAWKDAKKIVGLR